MNEALNTQQLLRKATSIREVLLERKSQKDVYEKELEGVNESISRFDEMLELRGKAALFLESIGTHARAQAKENLENIVTNALHYIFPEDMPSFHIDFTVRYGRPDARFIVRTTTVRDEVTIISDDDPKDEHGGGVLDVLSIILRIAMAELSGVKGPFIFDEPSKHLSIGNIERFATFLREISEMYGRQIILVTHSMTLGFFADKTYHVAKEEGISNVRLISTSEEAEAMMEAERLNEANRETQAEVAAENEDALD